MPPVAAQVLELESIRELLPGKQLLEIHALAQCRSRERQAERHGGETSHLLSPSAGQSTATLKGKERPGGREVSGHRSSERYTANTNFHQYDGRRRRKLQGRMVGAARSRLESGEPCRSDTAGPRQARRGRGQARG